MTFVPNIAQSPEVLLGELLALWPGRGVIGWMLVNFNVLSSNAQISDGLLHYLHMWLPTLKKKTDKIHGPRVNSPVHIRNLCLTESEFTYVLARGCLADMRLCNSES